jgi:hypothetical protein
MKPLRDEMIRYDQADAYELIARRGPRYRSISTNPWKAPITDLNIGLWRPSTLTDVSALS